MAMTGTEIPVVVSPQGIIRADVIEQMKADHAEYLETTKEQRLAAAFSDEQMTRKLVRELGDVTKLDADQTNFAARSLMYTLSGIKRISHRERQDILELAFPVNRQGGAGIGTMAYREMDLTGEFRPLAATGTDLYEVGSNLTETEMKVRTLAAAMGWTQIELERAARANAGGGAPVDLQGNKRLAVMRAAERTQNNIAFGQGDNRAGLPGLFDYELNSVTVTGGWAGANPEDIMAEILAVVNTPGIDTDDYDADTLILPTTAYQYLNAPYRDMTIGKWLMNNTAIRQILKSSRLNSVTSTTNSLSDDAVMVAYQRSPEILEFMLPRDVQFFPVQVKGIHYSVPVLFDSAGLFLYKYGASGPVAFAVIA